MADGLNEEELNERDTDRGKPTSLDEFSDRLDRMRVEPNEKRPESAGAGLGRAMRISSELLAGLLVGGALGYGLDRFLETSPWFLLAGLGVGFAAGLRNMSRLLNTDRD